MNGLKTAAEPDLPAIPLRLRQSAASRDSGASFDLGQYSTLLEISRSITFARDLEGLFDELATHLRRVLGFDFLALVLHDAERNVMRMRVLTCDDAKSLVGEEFPIEAGPAGIVWKTQEPLIFDDLAATDRFPDTVDCLRQWGVKSACVLPLTSAHRRLGAMCIGSMTLHSYSAEDTEFLGLVSAQVAVAVDNALGHEESRTLHQQLARERDRLRSLLDLSSTAVSNLDLHEMFRAISASLRRLMECDYASLVVPEPDGGQLRLYGLDFPRGHGLLREGMPVAMDSPPGVAFRSQRPQVLRAQEFAELSVEDPAAQEGIREGCFLPLISRNVVLGTLNLGWRDENHLVCGCVEFLSDVSNQVAIAVENAINYQQIVESSKRLAVEKSYLEEEIRTEHNFEEIVGSSPALIRVLQEVETVAPTDSTVLIEGETGTGKEAIARAIHNLSSRKGRTFVKLNCAAIPTGLLESELFGHEKGAFTGAIAQKLGRFELADKGTLFLDEVGDIPLELQPKLLRVLQEQEFERLGSTRTQRVNVRVIAATNRDLAQAVAGKQFRSDLYYRLNVFPVRIPALRDRDGDVALLVRHFVQRYARLMKKEILSIPQAAMDALVGNPWPGNVRELEHLIERAVIMTQGPALELPLAELAAVVETREVPVQRAETYEGATRDTVLKALEASNWVIGGPKGAAARLGLGRTTLQYKIRKLRLTRSSASAAK